MSVRLSYAVLLYNERETFTKLVEQLYRHPHSFEIRVVLDGGDPEMRTLLESYAKTHSNFYFYERALNKNFSAQRNFIGAQCQGQYIVRLDADELMPVYFLENSDEILDMFDRKQIDVVRMPRINDVGLSVSDEVKKRERIEVNDRGWANFPDMQTKIYKNTPDMKWIYSVQEHLMGWSEIYDFPPKEQYAIWHHKPAEKLVHSNSFYRSFKKRYWEKFLKSLKKRLGVKVLK